MLRQKAAYGDKKLGNGRDLRAGSLENLGKTRQNEDEKKRHDQKRGNKKNNRISKRRFYFFDQIIFLGQIPPELVKGFVQLAGEFAGAEHPQKNSRKIFFVLLEAF